MSRERAKRPVNEILASLLKKGLRNGAAARKQSMPKDLPPFPWITNGQSPGLFGICIDDPVEGPLEIVFELPPGASCPLCDELHQDRDSTA